MIDQECDDGFWNWVIHILFYHIKIWNNQCFNHFSLSLLSELWSFRNLNGWRNIRQFISWHCIVIRVRAVKTIKGHITKTDFFSFLFLNILLLFFIACRINIFQFTIYNLRLSKNSPIIIFLLEFEHVVIILLLFNGLIRLRFETQI